MVRVAEPRRWRLGQWLNFGFIIRNICALDWHTVGSMLFRRLGCGVGVGLWCRVGPARGYQAIGRWSSWNGLGDRSARG